VTDNRGMPANLGPSHDAQEDALQRLAGAFPEAITDGKVDLERLKQALGDHVETGRERYGLTWPGKAEAIKAAQRPSLGTLRPKAGEGINEESTGNLIIEGDNLEVLKLLQKAYLGKIKMIYIDPPYNTGNDFVYEDNFADPLAGYLEQTGQTVDGKRLSTNTETAGRYHSNWLSMMYPRLTLARNLLREDGVIFISIDETELAALKLITAEVFGEENVIETAVWRRKRGKDNSARFFSRSHEYIVVVARNTDALQGGFSTDMSEETKTAYSNPDNDSRGPWRQIAAWATGQKSGSTYSINLDGVEIPARRWVYSKDRLSRMWADNRLVLKGANADGKPNVYVKFFLAESTGAIPDSLWVDHGTAADGQDQVKELFGQIVFPTVKPLPFMKAMIKMISDPSALILDFFAGSGTTAQAVLEMNEEDGGNRKFILVQLPEVVDEDSAAAKAGFANIVEITKERVRRVIKKLDGGTREGLGLDGKKNLDRGFKVYALDRSNFVPWDATAATDAASLEKQLELAVDNVVHGRSHADLLAEILLKTGFPLDSPITTVTIAGTDVYQVADPGFLVCLTDTVDAPLIKAIAATKPHRVVILDAAFQGNDALKTNAVQAFKDQGVEMFRTA
jgi:adenine-specific DNA-methyltransferase